MYTDQTKAPSGEHRWCPMSLGVWDLTQTELHYESLPYPRSEDLTFSAINSQEECSKGVQGAIEENLTPCNWDWHLFPAKVREHSTWCH